MPHTIQILVGRIAVIAVFALGALWAPVIGRFESLWIYLQSVGAYLMMPFVGVFFLGVLWKRTTTRAVVASLVTGFAVGPLLMADSRGHFIPVLDRPLLRPWLHGAIIEFLVCTAVLVFASLMTAPAEAGKLAATTVSRREAGPASETGVRDYRPWLALVVTATLVLWYLMR